MGHGRGGGKDHLPRLRGRTWPRPRALGRTTLSPSVTILAYSTRALPCLSYIATLAPPPPPRLPRPELQLTASLLRIPHNAYPRGVMHNLRQVRLPDLLAARPYCRSMQVATALRMRDMWSQHVARLDMCRDAIMPLRHVADGQFQESAWSFGALARALRDSVCDSTYQKQPRVAACSREISADAATPRREILRALMVAGCGDSLDKSFRPRIAAPCSRYALSGRKTDRAFLGQQLHTAVAQPRAHSLMCCVLCLRTWCEACTTSQRCQKGAIPCLWACAPVAVDAQAHLLRSPHLCAALERCLRLLAAGRFLQQMGFGGGRQFRPGVRSMWSRWRPTHTTRAEGTWHEATPREAGTRCRQCGRRTGSSERSASRIGQQCDETARSS